MPPIESRNASLTYDAPGRPSLPSVRKVFDRLVGRAIHLICYYLLLRRRGTSEAYAAGFRFVLPPTVFHPKYFLTGEFFAGFIGTLDLRGRRVADIGTGSGILALAAARAGARQVIAVDINPTAAWAASENARHNGLSDRVSGICSNLLSSIAPGPTFDVIVSNPPYFPGEPRDLADRAWHSGPEHRDIVALFDQARERLAPGGRMYVLFSVKSDLATLASLIERARLRARLVDKRSIVIDSFVVYELEPV